MTQQNQPGAGLSTYVNPILPGWHSDPSCTFVRDWDNTFFLTTSSFLAFPGCPIYASKDLVSWKLVSHAINRREQVPEFLTSSTGDQQEGPWASTLRYRNGLLYLLTTYISRVEWRPKALLFTTSNPFDDTAWSDPIQIENPGNDIDPDLFWDDDGQAYMTVAAGIWLSKVDLVTGAASKPTKIWSGTGRRNPEGPHLYKKDDSYYLLLAEGGTETGHSSSIARSRSITGPYESCAENPILSSNSDGYFQTIGHADFFQDAENNWWGVALATRSGPSWEAYPMGRETVLFPIRWNKDGWPTLQAVQGRMMGPLPNQDRNLPGTGAFVTDEDIVDFHQESPLPRHFITWRPQKSSVFDISPPGHPNTLRILPSRTSLGGFGIFGPNHVDGPSFIGRKQTSTLFNYSVDVSFQPVELEEEAGVTVFLTQKQHMDLGIVNLPSARGDEKPQLHLRFRVEASGKSGTRIPDTIVMPIPAHWTEGLIRLRVSTQSDTSYIFSAAPAADSKDSRTLGVASADIVSGGTGPFSGE